MGLNAQPQPLPQPPRAHPQPLPPPRAHSQPPSAPRGRAGGPPGSPARIEIEIGELAFTGFGRLDHERVTDAFRRELTRLVGEYGVPAAVLGDTAPDVLSGLPPLPATTSPRRLGEALARAVHVGLAGGGDRRTGADAAGGRERP